MSSPADVRKRIADCRTAILTANAQAKEREHIGRANEVKMKELNEVLMSTKKLRDDLRECINHVVAEYKSIEKYAADRKELALNMLKTAIEKAGYIVPDANTAGMQLEVHDKKARIVDKNGTDMNLREGSAFRTVLGSLTRYTLLKTDPDALQILFLDEMFNTLSDETTAEMKAYFEVFKEDTLIVGIEQRAFTFDGILDVEYQAIKTNGKTEILRKG